LQPPYGPGVDSACNRNEYQKYKWTPVSAGKTFRDLPRKRETADNTEHYTYNV